MHEGLPNIYVPIVNHGGPSLRTPPKPNHSHVTLDLYMATESMGHQLRPGTAKMLIISAA